LSNVPLAPDGLQDPRVGDVADCSPIRVFLSDGYWRVAYGGYTGSFHATRAEAIATARVAAAREHRELEIEATG
jgi:hypothetical protein